MPIYARFFIRAYIDTYTYGCLSREIHTDIQTTKKAKIKMFTSLLHAISKVGTAAKSTKYILSFDIPYDNIR